MMTWLFLIISLPTQNATERMRVWRALKALGCGVLRDGVYLLPDSATARESLQQQADDVEAANGSAYLVTVQNPDVTRDEAFKALFDRTPDYTKLIADISQFRSELDALKAPAIRRALKALQRDWEGITAMDYFPGAAKEQALHAYSEIEAAVTTHFAPDEPHAIKRNIPLLDVKLYQKRVWATRKKLWVDRMASAWLIRRFIDKKAKFIWLEKPKNCPRDALGFDFDGATFTHIGARVTFEVLLASFSLDRDAGLTRVGGLVHYLDVGGIPVAEAVGVEMVLRGAQQRCKDDDALLAEAAKIFDDIYTAYTAEGTLK